MSAGNRPLRMLCWEGYDTPSIVDPYVARERVDFQVETLLSDATTAQRLAQGDLPNWDVLNINNAYIRDYLHPRGMIKPLDNEKFAHYAHSIHPLYEDLLRWSYDRQGNLIGLGQRFGPFNLVVNTDAISRSSAKDQGFELVNDPANQGRFGILNYPDFNIFHFCIGAGLNPFVHHGQDSLARFEQIAREWYQAAKYVVDDHHFLNRALINRDIDFYISGGIYTASPARLSGHLNVVAITPGQGPIDGKGGIVFTEITSVLNHAAVNPNADCYLLYLLESATAVDIAFVDGTCNPVAQMGDPRVFNAFSSQQLAAIQWDELAADLARCAHYQIPPQNEQLLKILNTARSAAGWT